jgi:hypothetical protein
MSSDSSRGGVTTPEAPPSSPQPAPQTEHPPAAVRYPQHQYSLPHPVSPAPYRYPPAQRPPAGGTSQWVPWVIGGAFGVLVLGGLLIALVAALVGGVVVSTIGQREQTATSTKTFVVSGTPSMVISDAAGNITIQSGSSSQASQVSVQVTKHAWGSSVAIAQSGLSNTTVDMSQSGSKITVTSQFSTTYFDGGMARRSVDVLVTVPAQSKADVHLGAGNVDVRQITGSIRLDTGAGNMTVENATFVDVSRLNTGAGNIRVDGAIASGALVDVQVGAGNATLTLPSDTPAHLDASTGIGNLTITGWQLSKTGVGIAGHRASGDLGVSPTAMLTVQVGTGNLTLLSR